MMLDSVLSIFAGPLDRRYGNVKQLIVGYL
jgi:hypothetical protein